MKQKNTNLNQWVVNVDQSNKKKKRREIIWVVIKWGIYILHWVWKLLRFFFDD